MHTIRIMTEIISQFQQTVSISNPHNKQGDKTCLPGDTQKKTVSNIIVYKNKGGGECRGKPENYFGMLMNNNFFLKKAIS